MWGHIADVNCLFAMQTKALGKIARLSYREDCRSTFVNLMYVKENLDLFPDTRMFIVIKKKQK